MTEKNDKNVDPMEAAREHDIEELATVLLDEFAAVTRAADRLHEISPAASALPDADLLRILAQLRVGRAVDDLTVAFIDLKDQEARAARDLLDELEDDDDEFDDDDDDDEFGDDEFDDEDFDEEDDDELDIDDFGEFIDPDHTDDRS